MALSLEEQWLKDTLGYALPAGDAGGSGGAGDSGGDASGQQAGSGGAADQAAQGGADGAGAANGAATGAATGDGAAAGGAGGGAAGADGASADGAAGPGADGQKYEATATFTLVTSSHPTVKADDTGAAGGADASGGGDAEPEGGGEGKGEGDAIAAVVGKVVEIGEKVVTALANHTKITNSDSKMSVLPEKTPGNMIRNGAAGSAKFHFEMHGNLFNNTLCNLDFEIDYMVCTVFGNKGRFLKDIRLNVTGGVSPGVTVDIQAAYGEAGTTGPSPQEWVVDLEIDIHTHWNSGYLWDGKANNTIRLNADTGWKVA